MQKKLLLLFVPIVLIALSACNNDYYQTRAEEKVVGQYKFQKVTKNEGFLNTDNITGEYNNMILQLNDEFEAALIDQNNNITYTGYYEVIASNDNNWSDDDDGGDREYTIIIDLRNSGRGNSGYYFVGQDARIRPHKLIFNVYKGNDTYRYKLDKI